MMPRAPEGDQGEQAEQGRGGAQDCEIGPLPLGFDAEVAANPGQRDLDPPTLQFIAAEDFFWSNA